MWKTLPDENAIEGLVQIVAGDDNRRRPVWSVDARGGARGIRVIRHDADGSEPDSRDTVVALQPVGRDSLPVLAEQFIRGDELHLSYPQREGSFALRLVLKTIALTDRALVLEVVLSVQTDLLDSHPKIDIVAGPGRTRRLSETQHSHPVTRPAAATGSAPIAVCGHSLGEVAVLLGPRDCPFTRDQSGDDELRLRLFGDFLEKGVIRKARPWIVVSGFDGDPSAEPMDDAGLRDRWLELSESPLPLTP